MTVAESAPIRHGTRYRYNKVGCRCDECRAAQRAYRARRLGRPVESIRSWTEQPEHGYVAYIKAKCRCDVCRAEHTEYQRLSRRARKTTTLEQAEERVRLAQVELDAAKKAWLEISEGANQG